MGIRVVVAGEIYSTNLGDGIIFECLRHLFGENGAEAIPLDLAGRTDWVPIDVQKVSAARKLMRISMQRSAVLRKSRAALHWYLKAQRESREIWRQKVASSDAVVIGGGQLLSDYDFGFLPRIYEIARIAREFRKPLAVFGCGSSRLWGSVARRMYGSVLREAAYVSVRDKESANLLSQFVGSGLQVQVHPDPAFAIKRVFPDVNNWEASGCLGINVQPAEHFKRHIPHLRGISDYQYLEFWMRLARGAIASGNRVKFFTNGNWNDYEVAEKIVSKLLDEGLNVELHDMPARPLDLIEQINNMSSIICTRMHAGIVAHGFGKEVTPISWDPKVRGVWDQIGCLKWVQPGEILLNKDPWHTISSGLSNRANGALDNGEIIAQIESATARCIETLDSHCR